MTNHGWGDNMMDKNFVEKASEKLRSRFKGTPFWPDQLVEMVLLFGPTLPLIIQEIVEYRNEYLRAQKGKIDKQIIDNGLLLGQLNEMKDDWHFIEDAK